MRWSTTRPNSACRIEIPLVRPWWLCKKKGKAAYGVPRVEHGCVEFRIGHDLAAAPTKETDGTVTRTGAVFVACGTAVPLSYVRTEGKARRIGARLMAAEGDRRRVFVAPTPETRRPPAFPAPEDAAGSLACWLPDGGSS